MNLPVEFVEKMKNTLKDEWDQFIDSYENDRFYSLRFNILKKNQAGMIDEDKLELFKSLVTVNEEVKWAKNGFYYDDETHPGKHPYHEMGLYYIQEPSAMSVASLLDIEPGMKVADLCAAPGGKSTQAASYLKGQGLLVSNEINTERARILSSNIERMGIDNAIVTNEDTGRLTGFFRSFFHAIIVDAPCSGEGMFRKNPAAVDEWSPEAVMVCQERQREILDNAATMLLPGGKMAYSTCTFSREENEDNVEWFLETHEDFELYDSKCQYFSKTYDSKGNELKGAYRLWPHKVNGEGHFVAVFKKKGALPEGSLLFDAGSEVQNLCDDMDTSNCKKEEKSCKEYVSKKEFGNKNSGYKNDQYKDSRYKKGKSSKKGKNDKSSNALDGEKMKLLKEFLEAEITEPLKSRILNGNLILFKDNLYMLPRGIESIAGLRVLRAGLCIGEFKKNRFEPSHALALAIGAENVVNSYDIKVDDDRCRAYFAGESISIDSDSRGFLLLTVDGFSAGWTKAAQGIAKNHYPKGLRKLF